MKNKASTKKKKREDRMFGLLMRDIERGREVFMRASLATWWEWERRSVLYFWRWALGYLADARDGTRVFAHSKLPRYLKLQRWPSDVEDKR